MLYCHTGTLLLHGCITRYVYLPWKYFVELLFKSFCSIATSVILKHGCKLFPNAKDMIPDRAIRFLSLKTEIAITNLSPYN